MYKLSRILITSIIFVTCCALPVAASEAPARASNAPESDHAGMRRMLDELREDYARAQEADQRVNAALGELSGQSSRVSPQSGRAAALSNAGDSPADKTGKKTDKKNSERLSGKAGVKNSGAGVGKAASGESFNAPTKKAAPVATASHMRQNSEAERLIKKTEAKSLVKYEPKPELPAGMSIDGGKKNKAFDHLAPRRDVLPGAKHTLSQMEKNDAPEGALRYRLDRAKSARLSINEDDENHPGHTRRKDDSGLNSAGLYLDVEMDEKTDVYVGGHHRNLYGEPLTRNTGPTDTGVSIGLKREF